MPPPRWALVSSTASQPKKDPGQSSEANQDNPSAAYSDKPPQPTKYPQAMGYPYLNIHGRVLPHPIRLYLELHRTLSLLFSGLTLHPAIPVFYVDKFSVNSFKVSNDVAVTGIWEADITVQNPNHKLKIFFDRIDNYMFYEDEVLTSSSLGGHLYLDTKAQDSFHVRLSRNTTLDENMLPKSTVNAMEQEYGDNGWVNFSFRMLAWTTLEYGSWWSRLKTMEVLCDNLKVGFVGATGNIGKSRADQPLGCAVYV
ncbi:hypothetical protein CIPAW_10G016800 [Carya illinoinensis]|uniref:Late embryogenesis abundant protein LEA-2 subgroup domain-containing protein n=1 Tax=Carya illinoinensis TaxID=32201 RepID=A0A8T1P8S6_CARIL|nr:hypothetical protein CIPAW_10G016800 [Carya illinoinensis]